MLLRLVISTGNISFVPIGNSLPEELAELTNAGADMAVTKPLRDGLLATLFAHLYTHGFASRTPQKLQCVNGVVSLVG
jgi:hypothetical protein